LTVEVNRNDRFNRLAGPETEWTARRCIDPARSQVFLERRWAQVVGALVDVDEFCFRPSLADAFDRGNERVRDGEDRITAANTRGHQCEADSVGAAGERDRVGAAGVVGELTLEALDFLASDEACRAQR